MVRRLACAALLMMCGGCASMLWGDYEARYPDVAPLVAPAAPTAAPAQTRAAAPAPAPRLAVWEPSVVDFACTDGSRLRVTYSPDRARAVAHWSDGAQIALLRADEDGLIRYAAAEGELIRAGRRVAWAGPRTVRVRPGDTLWKISERIYGRRDRGGDIARANAEIIRDPDLIYPGQTLRLPGAGERRRFCMRPLGPRVT